MSDFLKSSFGGAPPGQAGTILLLSPFQSSGKAPDQAARKEAMMNNVRTELALANAQELMNVSVDGFHLFLISCACFNSQKTNEKCYAKCVPKPSTRLSGSEEVTERITYMKSRFAN
jgi:hypothetical protein